MKQSLIFVALQVVNLLLGLFITLYVATNLQPDIYAVFVLYTIVNGVYVTFTAFGYETVLLRNALKWQERRSLKITNYMTYALVSRVLSSAVLAIPVFAYLMYISYRNYSGEYLGIFSLFIMSGFFSAINNSLSLFLKSFNRYISSFVTTIIGALIVKILAIYSFINFGFNAYLSTMIVSPIIIFFILLKLTSTHFLSFKFKLKYLKKTRKIIDFGVLGYAKYLVGQSDRLIVSLILTPEILASYSLARQVQDIGKSLIEGFFDPLCQAVVKYKGNKNKLETLLNKIRKIHVFMMIISILVVGIFMSHMQVLLIDLGLGEYKYLEQFIFSAMISSVIYLFYKVQVNVVSIYEAPKKLLTIDLVSWIISLSVMSIMIVNDSYSSIYIGRVVAEMFLFVSFISLWILNKDYYKRYKGI